jgi:hypothetical protein
MELRHMFEVMGYHRLLKLDDGLGDPNGFNEDVRAFSRTFDLELDTMRCRSRVFERSYDRAKEKMDNGEISSLENGPVEELSPTDYQMSGWFSRWEQYLESIAAKSSSDVRNWTWQFHSVLDNGGDERGRQVIESD